MNLTRAVRRAAPTLLLCAAWSMTPGAVQPTPSATCTSVGLDPERTWRLAKPGPAWHVMHWRGTTPKDVARLSLPATAVVRLSPLEVDVTARTSNGGIDVRLSGPPAQARLDIYVSYELEVNVDTSLTPLIDDLNTDGPIGVRCHVEQPR